MSTPLKKNPSKTFTIPPRSGTSFVLPKDKYLKVICPEGEQVSDMVAYKYQNTDEYLFNGKTFDYEETLLLTTGNFLYSNESNKMLEIVDDTCKVHDFLLAPCCKETFKHFYNQTEEGPSCKMNLYDNLVPYNIGLQSIPTAFNIFMNVHFDLKGRIKVLPPKAQPGDYIVFKAYMDLIIALTSCSAGASNNYSYKKIDYQLLDDFEVVKKT